MEAPKALIRSLLGSLAIFIVLFVLIVTIINWPAVQSTVAYTFVPPKPTTVVAPNPGQPHTTDTVVISKLGIELPIVWDQSVDAVPDALSHGVAQLAGTARPGELGNTVIIGHSSDYVWKRNPYAAAFALLPHLKAGDQISFYSGGALYTYIVQSTAVVAADDVEVVNATTTAEATLITCYPIGTAWKRFIVRATLQGQVTKPSTPASSEKLPTLDIR